MVLSAHSPSFVKKKTTPKKQDQNPGQLQPPNVGASEEEAETIAGLQEVGELQTMVPGSCDIEG